MEGGVRCPNCGSYTSFSDIIATGHCRGIRRADPCETALAIDLVIRHRDITVEQTELYEADPGFLERKD